jgi:hypothetical protein
MSDEVFLFLNRLATIKCLVFLAMIGLSVVLDLLGFLIDQSELLRSGSKAALNLSKFLSVTL